MERNFRRMCIIALIMLMLFIPMLSGKAYAAGEPQGGIGDPTDYDPKNSDYDVPTDVTNIAGTIISIIQTVGIVLAVVVIVILGIKYITGYVQEKANFKATMIPYLVGVALLVITPTIVRIIYELTTQAIE